MKSHARPSANKIFMICSSLIEQCSIAIMKAVPKHALTEKVPSKTNARKDLSTVTNLVDMTQAILASKHVPALKTNLNTKNVSKT